MLEVTRQSATELAANIRARRVSAREAVAAYQQRIHQFNPQLNAYIWLNPEAEREAAALDNSSGPAGPLHGVPISIKSCIAVTGAPWECGSKLREGIVAESDATLVSRLKRAGAIVLGVTNNPEMLMAYETDNDLYGRTNNPWDLERTAGGSSGGESAAIAAMMSAAGVGSDGGGSIRVPAHFCGICGLKPTPGRIPLTGHFPESGGPFAHTGVVGPMARTIADLQHMFEVMTGYDRADVASLPIPFRRVSDEEARVHPIGFFEDDGITPVTPETRSAIRLAAEALRAQGYRVEPFRPEWLAMARKLWYTFFVVAGGAVLEPLYKRMEPSLFLRELLDRYRAQPQPDFFTAWFQRDKLRVQFLEQMRRYPVLLCPAAAVPAFRHRQREWVIDGKTVHYMDPETDIVSYTQWFNLLGMPGTVVPVSQSDDGLPIGVQIIGRPFDDEVTLAVAADVERAFGYHPPPMEWTESAKVQITF